MWVFISVVLLLTHTTVGAPEVESLQGTASSMEENDSNQTEDKVMNKRNAQETIMWTGEKLPTLKSNPKTADLGKTNYIKTSNLIEKLNLPIKGDRSRKKRFIDEIDSDMKIMLKKSESVPLGSWFYSPKKQNGLPSDEGQDLSQEKKSPSFNPWGGKRLTLFRTSPRIRRPIRVPFNSWGGKRGDEDVANESEIVYGKRAKLLYDLNDRQEEGPDGFDVKRLAEGSKNGRRVPFNSWGGKRSSYEDFDRGSEDLIGDGRLRSVKENPTNEDSIVEREIDKRRMGNGKYQIRFNSWGGKRYKNAEDLAHLLKVNETDDGYVTEHKLGEESEAKEVEEEDNDIRWLRIPNKRNIRGQRRSGRFEPWGGKRNLQNDAALLENDYSGLPPEPMRREVFFPWGG